MSTCKIVTPTWGPLFLMPHSLKTKDLKAPVTGGTNKGPAYYGEGSPGFYSITLTKCTYASLNLQHYCLGWVLFPPTHRETATLERLERGIPLICPSHLAGRHSTLSLAVQTETEESPDRAH